MERRIKSLHKVLGYDWTIIVNDGSLDYVLIYIRDQGWTVKAWTGPGVTKWLSPDLLTFDSKFSLTCWALGSKEINQFIKDNRDNCGDLKWAFWENRL